MLLQIIGFLQNIDNFYALLQTFEDFYSAYLLHSEMTNYKWWVSSVGTDSGQSRSLLHLAITYEYHVFAGAKGKP